MRIAKTDIPTRIETRGATARQQSDFGDVQGYGTLGAEHFSLGKGTDLKPLLAGLEHDLCHSPHWGYVIDGALTVTYRDGSSEQAAAGDLFYWPPYHTVRADDDSEIVLFSPQREHGAVIDHVKRKLGA